MVKNLILGPVVTCLAQIRAVRSSSVTTYHGQLSVCTISERTNDPILIKCSDGRTHGHTDELDFTGRCPTNAKRPISARQPKMRNIFTRTGTRMIQKFLNKTQKNNIFIFLDIFQFRAKFQTSMVSCFSQSLFLMAEWVRQLQCMYEIRISNKSPARRHPKIIFPFFSKICMTSPLDLVK